MPQRKHSCTITEPRQRVNDQIVQSKSRQVTRATAVGYLRSCRQGMGLILRLRAGHYSILPHGLQHGFKLDTRR